MISELLSIFILISACGIIVGIVALNLFIRKTEKNMTPEELAAWNKEIAEDMRGF